MHRWGALRIREVASCVFPLGGGEGGRKWRMLFFRCVGRVKRYNVSTGCPSVGTTLVGVYKDRVWDKGRPWGRGGMIDGYFSRRRMRVPSRACVSVSLCGCVNLYMHVWVLRIRERKCFLGESDHFRGEQQTFLGGSRVFEGDYVVTARYLGSTGW